MPETFLTSTSHSNFTQASDLTPLQVQMDGLVSTFVERTMDSYALAGIVSGGIANGGVKGSLLHFARPFVRIAPIFSSVAKGGALAAGVIAEGAVFHGFPQGLKVLTGGELSLLHLHGAMGLKEGALHSITGLVGLKIAGVATASFHSVVQNFAQATAMVGTNHAAAVFLGIGDKPRGEVTQQLADAESTVLHLWVGMRILHQAAPSHAQWGQTRDLKIQSIDVGAVREPPLPDGLIAMVMEGNPPSGKRPKGKKTIVETDSSMGTSKTTLRGGSKKTKAAPQLTPELQMAVSEFLNTLDFSQPPNHPSRQEKYKETLSTPPGGEITLEVDQDQYNRRIFIFFTKEGEKQLLLSLRADLQGKLKEKPYDPGKVSRDEMTLIFNRSRNLPMREALIEALGLPLLAPELGENTLSQETQQQSTPPPLPAVAAETPTTDLSPRERLAEVPEIKVSGELKLETAPSPTDEIFRQISDPVWVYANLSPLAKKGFDLLAERFPSLKEKLDLFLVSPAVQSLPEGTMDEILETVVLLHEAGVQGYQRGFSERGIDDKFHSEKHSRILSLLEEYRQALSFVTDLDVRNLKLSHSLPIDWKLNPREQKYIEENIAFRLPEDLRKNYLFQKYTEADFIAIWRKNGKFPRRIGEVKTSEQEIYDLSSEDKAALLLQAFRLSLVARKILADGQPAFEGVEHIFVMKNISEEGLEKLNGLLSELRSIYQLMGVPCLIRVITGKGEIDPIEGGLSKIPPKAKPSRPAVETRALLLEPAREQEIPAGTEQKTKPDKNEKKEPELFRRKEVKDFLKDVIKVPELVKADNENAFTRLARIYLRYAIRQEIADSIEKELGKNSYPAAATIRELLEKFKGLEEETLSRTEARLLVRIVRLATSGEEETAAPDKPAPIDHTDLVAAEWNYRQLREIFEIALESAHTHKDPKRFWEDLIALVSDEYPLLHDKETFLQGVRTLENLLRPQSHRLPLTLAERIQGEANEIERSSRETKTSSSPPTPPIDPAVILATPIDPEILKEHPELHWVDEKALLAQIEQRKEFATPGRRTLLQMMALLEAIRPNLSLRSQEEVDTLLLELETTPHSTTHAELTRLAVEGYKKLRGEILSNIPSLDRVGALPEIRGEGPKLTGLEAGRAVQNILNQKRLPVDLQEELLKNFEEAQEICKRTPEKFTETYLAKVADLYWRHRERIEKIGNIQIVDEHQNPLDASAPPQKLRNQLEEKYPELDLIEDKNLASSITQTRPIAGKYLLLKIESLLDAYFLTLPEDSPLQKVRRNILRRLHYLSAVGSAGVRSPHLVERISQEVLEIYQSNRERIFDHLCKKIGIEKVVASFRQIQEARISDSTFRAIAIPGVQIPRLDGFETAIKVAQILFNANGHHRQAAQDILWRFNPPSDEAGPKEVREALKPMVERLLSHYVKYYGKLQPHQKGSDTAFSLDALAQEIQKTCSKFLELLIVTEEWFRDEQQLYKDFLRSLTNISDPQSILRYKSSQDMGVVLQTTFVDTDVVEELTKRVGEGERLVVLTKSGSFKREIPPYSKFTKKAEITPLIQMQLILEASFPFPIAQMIAMTELFELPPGKISLRTKMQLDIDRAAALLLVGLDPAWVIPSLFERILRTYREGQPEIRKQINFAAYVADLPEIANQTDQEVFAFFMNMNISPDSETGIGLASLRANFLIKNREKTMEEVLAETYLRVLKVMYQSKSGDKHRQAILSLIGKEMEKKNPRSIVAIATEYYVDHQEEILADQN
jgi:hypothetical protein